MGDIFRRNKPKWYNPVNISFSLNAENDIVAEAYFVILNPDGDTIDQDHPTVTLTPAQRSAFVSWFLSQCEAYEAATGLTRYTGD